MKENETVHNDNSVETVRLSGIDRIIYIITILACTVMIFTMVVCTACILDAESKHAAPTEPTTSVPTEPTEPSETTPDNVVETPTEPPTEPVIEETEPVIDEESVELLACVIYQEAGGDLACDECRRRVADVVLNRVADPRFPDTIYEVLTAPKQYGRFSVTGVVWPPQASTSYEKHAVERAYRIAREVLSGQHSSLYGNGYIWQAEFKQGTDNIYCCGHYFGK